VKKRPLALLVAVTVVAGGLVVARATVASCGPDKLPARIGSFQQTNRTATSPDRLPARSGWPPGRPAVVVDLPPLDVCPFYIADQNDDPMDIWLRVTPNLYVEYGRTGGGP